MNSSDLISIIVPIFNVEKYLRKCIESLLRQTYKNIEILLIDDGSPDKCPKICDEYSKKDNRIRVFHKKNGGLSDARNYGIEKSKGKYLTFVDSDDYVEEHFIELLYKSLLENHTLISQCNINLVSEQGDFIKSWNNIHNVDCIDGNTLISDYITNNSISSCNIVVWNKMYNRCLFDKIQFKVGKINEDEFFTYKVFYNNRISLVNKQLYNYMQNSKGIMGSLKKNIKLDIIEALVERTNFFKEKDDFLYRISYLKMMDLIIFYNNLVLKNPTKDLNKNRYLKSMFRQLYKKIDIELSKKRKIKYILFYYFPMLYSFFSNSNIKKNLSMIKNGYINFNLSYVKFKIKSLFFNTNCILFGTPSHGNLGDHAIAYAEERILKKMNTNYFIVPGKYIDYFLDKKKVNEKTTILYTGGGFLGSVWENEQELFNKVISKYYKNNIVVFPQTVYYEKNEYGNNCFLRDKKNIMKCKNIIFYCRDENTYKFMNKSFKNVFYVPDIVLSLSEFSNKKYNRNGIALCLRNDKESILNKDDKEIIINLIKEKFDKKNIYYISTTNNKFYNNYKSGIKDFKKLIVNSFANKELIITDRLHGMIFSVITSTPCIAFGNSTGKVKGVYNWICKDNKFIYFVDNIDSFKDTINKIDFNSEYKYKDDYINSNLKKINLF